MSGSNKDLDKYKNDLLLAKRALITLLKEINTKLKETNPSFKTVEKPNHATYDPYGIDYLKSDSELESDISSLEVSVEFLQEQLEENQREWFETIIGALKLEDYLKDFRDDSR